ncbi:uncharacterized protein LOC129798970 [Phlebotomus papatasi]|uniref:Uncharacterized protein n=1 Tax=Phlebotomus papatasi TaxID=29031 RepID=A0A1B0D0S0_PHLPP|nr:uncharacterized protein LOC129798970 [Phlebotomus papatasi]
MTPRDHSPSTFAIYSPSEKELEGIFTRKKRNTMKVLAVFIALVAVVTAQSDFAQELQEFHENFNDFHLELDYWLRDRRHEVSDTIREANRVALGQVWDDVTAVRFITESARQAIDYRADQIGETECIVGIRERLTELESESGDKISACARNLHRDYQHSLDYGFFIHLNYAQRMSHFLQLLVLYNVGNYNPFSDQEFIRWALTENWEHRENLRDEEYIMYYRDQLENGKSIGNINVENCLLTVASIYNIDVNQLRDDLTQC